MGKKAICYVGWLGHQNIGDEAIYLAIQNLFHNYELKPYNSYTFLVESKYHPLMQIEHPFSSVSIFGGGTLLPDDVTWIRPNKYNIVFGAGVKDPIFHTKYDNFDKTVIDRLRCFNFRFLGVRDNKSKLLLEDWGIASEVIGDPALSLKPNLEIKRDDSKIAVNIGCGGHLWGGDQESVVHEVTRVCKILKNEGFNPVLLPFSQRDLESVNRVSLAAKIEVFDKWSDIEALVDFIASSKVLIGQRLHSAVLSAAAFTPFICLAYQPKCSAFSESVGMSEYTVRTDKVGSEKILELFQILMSEWHKKHNELISVVEAFRKKQCAFAERIMSDLDLLPDSDWANVSFTSKVKNKLFWETDVFLRRKFGKIWKLYSNFFVSRFARYLL
ncbi:MAG: polysaccharide pyruvyl transferase family protein [Candidatus Jordarchaeaceae archaeon]